MPQMSNVLFLLKCVLRPLDIHGLTTTLNVFQTGKNLYNKAHSFQPESDWKAFKDLKQQVP